MFNPFNKSIGTPLDETDLLELINQKVSEGYYTEYKGNTFPSNNKIGHSIASFANTYGGWYFVGIETDGHDVASSICGFNLLTVNDPIAKVREIIASHVDPVPRFFIQIVNLEKQNCAVLVVYIPPNQDVPFITKDGRIYRRTHDSSEPISETNRYAVDRLYDEGQKTKENFEKFCRDERSFSKWEDEKSNLGWLNVFIKPITYSPIYKLQDNEIITLRKLLEKSRATYKIPLPFEKIDMDGNMPFNAGYPTLKSFILRQTTFESPAHNSLTVELFYDGSAKFHIPIQFFDYKSLLNNQQSSTEEIRKFLAELANQKTYDSGIELLKFFDLGILWSIVTTLSTFYLDWLDEKTLSNLKIGIELDKIWRAIPYFKSDEWLEHIREFGFPISSVSSIKFPEEIGDGFKFELDKKYRLANNLFEIIALAFGFPDELHGKVLVHLFTEFANQKKK
jgi:hypothetical protein